MNKCVLIVVTGFIFFSCSSPKTAETEADTAAMWKLEMMDTDREFSAMSEARGLRNAFIEFIDSNGVLLRPGTVPLSGGDAMSFISQSNDTAFIMKWEPKSAAIAASGELGYTYGIYAITHQTKDSVIYGSYVTIWKRQPNGKWKFILQSGNEGLE